MTEPNVNVKFQQDAQVCIEIPVTPNSVEQILQQNDLLGLTAEVKTNVPQ